MVCKKCNHKLPDDSEFCQYCGNKIEMKFSEENATTPTGVIEEIDADVSAAHGPKEASDPFEDVDVENVTPEEALNMILEIQAKQTVEEIEANKKNQPNHEGELDFGLVPEKPIYTLGTKLIDGETEFLSLLRTPAGEKIKWERRGSVSAEGVNGMIDIYNTYLLSGQLYKTIYINMYGAKRSTKAPAGFVLNDEISSNSVKTKYCSRCGSVIDKETKFCTGCDKKYFKIRLNKFSVTILIMSVVIAALLALNIFTTVDTNTEVKELKTQVASLEKQVNIKEKTIDTLRKENSDIRDKNWDYFKEHLFFDNYAEIVGDDGTNASHKYGCSWLDTSDGLWIFNSEYAKQQGYKKCPYCH